MNFFGHAAVAGRFSEQPAFLFGAMLPDFCGMLGLRAPELASTPVGDGIRFHHATDAVFHELPPFREWCRSSVAALEARRVARGTARAVAHVGLEFLLDMALAEGRAACDAYFSGLAAGRNTAVLDELSWPAEGRMRLSELTSLLAERGVMARVPSAVVLARLERTLERRPRLAIAPRDREAVLEWVELCRGDVVASTPALVAELVGELERRRAA
jgi:hypothetical protein